MNKIGSNLKRNILMATAFISIVLPTVAFAQSYTPLEPLPCVPGRGETTCAGGATKGTSVTSVDFQSYVQNMFNVLIAIAAAGAVFMIVFGGLRYMTTDSWTGKSAGIQHVKDALLGLVLVLTSFIILRTVDPRLVAIPTTLVTPLNIKATSSTNDLLGSLGTDANNFLLTNSQAQANITAAKGEIDNLNNQKAALETSILGYAGALGYTNTSMNALCAEQGFTPVGQRDSKITDACTQIQKINESVNVSQGKIYVESAKGTMSAAVNNCLKNNSTECKAKVEELRKLSESKLVGIGQSQQQVNDFAGYTTAMIDIMASLNKYNPAIGEKFKLNQDLGALLPGGNFFNSIQDLVLPNSISPCGTSKSIQSVASGAKVSDPTLKADLINQANSIKAKFGC